MSFDSLPTVLNMSFSYWSDSYPSIILVPSRIFLILIFVPMISLCQVFKFALSGSVSYLIYLILRSRWFSEIWFNLLWKLVIWILMPFNCFLSSGFCYFLKAMTSSSISVTWSSMDCVSVISWFSESIFSLMDVIKPYNSFFAISTLNEIPLMCSVLSFLRFSIFYLATAISPSILFNLSPSIPSKSSSMFFASLLSSHISLVLRPSFSVVASIIFIYSSSFFYIYSLIFLSNTSCY